MVRTLLLTDIARAQLDAQETPGEAQDLPKPKKVRKCLGLLQSNPRHPGLATHEYSSLAGPAGEKVREAYVENNTPGAWRVFWHYGPGQDVITILAITPHP